MTAEPALELMILDVLEHRDRAWQDLMEVLFPHVEAIVRVSRSMGPLRSSPDHCRSATTRVFEKLARNDYSALRLFTEWQRVNPEKTLDDWLRIVVTRVVRDYVGSQLGAPSADPDQERVARKRLLHTLASALPDDDHSPSARPPVTDLQTARQILDYARTHLSPMQLSALEAWINLADNDKVAAVIGKTPDEATKLVRSAVAKLRRQFAEDDED